MEQSAKIEKEHTNIPLENMINKNNDDKISDALMLKIKKENYSRFNKSFIILKLEH